jgi:phage recombination protein Bet
MARWTPPAVVEPFVEVFELSRAKIDLIKRTVCPKDTTDDELALFFHECQRRGVHPLDRLVHMTKFQDRQQGGAKVVFMVSIDYLRAQAEETGEYGGKDKPVFQGAGELPVQGRKVKVPLFAEVTVYRIVQGQRVPFTGEARWNEFYPGAGERGAMWRDKPFLMLAKCAEAQALRSAFPKRLGKLYAREELDRSFNEWESPRRKKKIAAAPPDMEQHDRTKKRRGPGRGRTRRAAAHQPPVVTGEEGITEIVEDFIDVEPVREEPTREGWIVEQLRPGKEKAAPHRQMWQLTAAKGDERRVAYTFDPEYAATLSRFQLEGRPFEFDAPVVAGVAVIDQIEPLSAV